MAKSKRITVAVIIHPPPSLFTIIRKVHLWWLGNVAFGAAPLLAVYLINAFGINEKSSKATKEDIDHILNDGAINFLCLALIGAICVDIYSVKDHLKNVFVSAMKWSAVGIAVVVTFVYTAFVLTNEHDGHFGDLKPLTNGLVVCALIYCTIGKINLILIEPRKPIK